MKLLDRTLSFVANRYIFVAMACYFTSLAALLAQYLAGFGHGKISYTSTSYAVNYFEYGFIKRGLIGTALAWIPSDNYILIALVCSIFAFLILLFVFSRIVEKIYDIKTRDFFKTTFAISPFTSFQFGIEIGRLDLYNILLLISILYLVHKQRWFLVLIFSAGGLLLHEAFATFAVPLIFAYALIQPSANTSYLRHGRLAFLACYFTTCALLAFLIAKHGNSDLVLENTPGIGQEAWSRTLAEPGFSKLGFLNLIVVLAITIGIYAFLINLYRTNNARKDMVFLATLSPLVLFLLGVDYARWTGLIAMTVLIVVFVKAVTDKWILTDKALPFSRAVFLLPLGPIGSQEVFPMLRVALSTFG